MKSYKANKQKADALRYEYEHFEAVTPEDTISAMSFSHGSDGIRAPAGHTSDKTAYIALNYQNKTNQSNYRTKADILDEYIPVSQAVDRLEHHMSLLMPREAKILYLRYRDGMKFAQIAEEMQLSTKSISNIHKSAISRLCEMYALRLAPCSQ